MEAVRDVVSHTRGMEAYVGIATFGYNRVAYVWATSMGTLAHMAGCLTVTPCLDIATFSKGTDNEGTV